MRFGSGLFEWVVLVFVVMIVFGFVVSMVLLVMVGVSGLSDVNMLWLL